MTGDDIKELLRSPKAIVAVVLLVIAAVLIVFNLSGGPTPEYRGDDRTADRIMSLSAPLEMAIKANPALASLDEIESLDAEQKRDTWGQPLELQIESTGEKTRTIRVVSGGPDKQVGTPDDIVAVFAQIWVQEYQEPGLVFVRIDRPAP